MVTPSGYLRFPFIGSSGLHAVLPAAYMHLPLASIFLREKHGRPMKHSEGACVLKTFVILFETRVRTSSSGTTSVLLPFYL
jgi:hypothetical protein